MYASEKKKLFFVLTYRKAAIKLWNKIFLWYFFHTRIFGSVSAKRKNNSSWRKSEQIKAFKLYDEAEKAKLMGWLVGLLMFEQLGQVCFGYKGHIFSLSSFGWFNYSWLCICHAMLKPNWKQLNYRKGKSESVFANIFTHKVVSLLCKQRGI